MRRLAGLVCLSSSFVCGFSVVPCRWSGRIAPACLSSLRGGSAAVPASMSSEAAQCAAQDKRILFVRHGMCVFAAVWVCGCVGVWVCGCVGVWVCGFAVRLWWCCVCVLLVVLQACCMCWKITVKIVNSAIFFRHIDSACAISHALRKDVP